MHLYIAGSSGRNGRLVIEAALQSGHSVTALVRDPASLLVHPRLIILQGSFVASPSPSSCRFDARPPLQGPPPRSPTSRPPLQPPSPPPPSSPPSTRAAPPRTPFPPSPRTRPRTSSPAPPASSSPPWTASRPPHRSQPFSSSIGLESSSIRALASASPGPHWHGPCVSSSASAP